MSAESPQLRVLRDVVHSLRQHSLDVQSNGTNIHVQAIENVSARRPIGKRVHIPEVSKNKSAEHVSSAETEDPNTSMNSLTSYLSEREAALTKQLLLQRVAHANVETTDPPHASLTPPIQHETTPAGDYIRTNASSTQSSGSPALCILRDATPIKSTFPQLTSTDLHEQSSFVTPTGSAPGAFNASREGERLELLILQLEAERRRGDNLFRELELVNVHNQRLEERITSMTGELSGRMGDAVMRACAERDRALQQERMMRLEVENIQREAQSRIAYLETQVQNSNTQMTQVQQVMSELRSATSSKERKLAEQLTDSQHMYQQLQQNTSSAQVDKTELQAQLLSERSRTRSLQSQYNACCAELTTTQQQLAELQAKLSKLNAEAAELAAAKAVANAAQERSCELQLQLADIDARGSKQSRELQQRLAELEARAVQAEAELDSRTHEQERLEQSAKRLSERADELTAELTERLAVAEAELRRSQALPT